MVQEQTCIRNPAFAVRTRRFSTVVCTDEAGEAGCDWLFAAALAEGAQDLPMLPLGKQLVALQPLTAGERADFEGSPCPAILDLFGVSAIPHSRSQLR